jgi:hypothetical protein
MLPLGEQPPVVDGQDPPPVLVGTLDEVVHEAQRLGSLQVVTVRAAFDVRVVEDLAGVAAGGEGGVDAVAVVSLVALGEREYPLWTDTGAFQREEESHAVLEVVVAEDHCPVFELGVGCGEPVQQRHRCHESVQLGGAVAIGHRAQQTFEFCDRLAPGGVVGGDEDLGSGLGQPWMGQRVRTPGCHAAPSDSYEWPV